MQQNDNFEINEDAVKDKIEMSPIEKFIRFNKFPWKLVLHAALLIFTTIQVLNMVTIASTYQKPILDVFKYVFLDASDEDYAQTSFYTLTDFQNHLGSLSQVLSNLDNYMLNKVDSADATYDLQVYYTVPNTTYTGANSNSNPSAQAINYTYNIPNISQGIVQPFNQSDISSLKAFIQTIESMNLNINSLYTSSQLVENQILCYNWSITFQYQFVAMSHINTLLTGHPSYCQFTNSSQSEDLMMKLSRSKTAFSRSRSLSSTQTYSPFGSNFDIIHIMVFLMAVASIGFSWYYIYEMGLLYMSTRQAKLNQDFYNELENKDMPYATSWEDLSFIEKVKLFDTFLILMMIGNVFQILGSITSLYQNYTPQDSSTLVSIKEACVGLGCMLCWINIIKYLRYNKQFKSTTSLLANSGSNFGKFLVGIVPLYMGFAFLGRCLFWNIEKFESTNHAIMALFSIMGGDIIEDTYADTRADGFLASLYMTVWIVLFMSAVHNVFISIISEGFRNGFLEDRYQELFNLYAVGDSDTVKQWNAKSDAKELFKETQIVEKKKEDVLSLMPYIRRDSQIAFDPQSQEKIRKSELERQKLKETILEKTDEVEKILANMKDIVNEFCSVSKEREEKKNVKTSFFKDLRDLHVFVKSELSKSQSQGPARPPVSRSLVEPRERILEEEFSPVPKRQTKKAVSFASPDHPEPEL